MGIMTEKYKYPTDEVSTNSVTDIVKSTLLTTTDVAHGLHNTVKKKFNTSVNDPNHGDAQTRTDELSQNAVTGFFLVLHKEKWSEFPKSMKALWILCILISSGIQWSTTFLLYLYIMNDEDEDEDDDDPAQGIQLLSSMMACVILFVYVFGEIRQSFYTLWHYWGILEFGILHYWILFMLFGEISLEITIAVLSTFAIQEEDNISDQLGISLAFFFILELDEWVYSAFIQDFDVLEEDDFNLVSIDPIKTKDIKDFYHRKAMIGIAAGMVLFTFCFWVAVYFYFIR